MATWKYSIGNLVSRSPYDPVGVSPATEDTLIPLTNLGSGYPDEQGGLTWRSDGVYDIDFDVNMLAISTSRADAPYGWEDLINKVSGTPGLPTNQATFGTYGTRTSALRFYRPSSQEVEVMPGEDFSLNCGLYRPSAASGSTGTRVIVTDLWSGKSWTGSAWASGGVALTQGSSDAWSDSTEEITADTDRTERSTYRITFEPIASSYDSTTYGYASLNGTNGSPALVPEADVFALIGHNLPSGSTVALGSTSLTPLWPSFFAEDTASYTQSWRLSIDMPSGTQPRPILGEVWIGKVRTFLRGPRKVQRSEGDRNQKRIESARGRIEVVSDNAKAPNSDITFQFTVAESEYEQVRDEVCRGGKFGAEPMLLLPDAAFEGTGSIYHTRVSDAVQFGRIGTTLRTFTLDFTESPFAAA